MLPQNQLASTYADDVGYRWDTLPRTTTFLTPASGTR